MDEEHNPHCASLHVNLIKTLHENRFTEICEMTFTLKVVAVAKVTRPHVTFEIARGVWGVVNSQSVMKQKRNFHHFLL